MTRLASRLAPLILLVAVVFATPAGAQDTVGQVVQQTGATSLLRDGQERPLRLGQGLRRGDRVATGPGARLRITFADGSALAIGENAAVEITAYADPGTRGLRAVLNVLYGLVRATVTPDPAGRDFTVRGRSAVVSVRSTDFTVEQTGDTTSVLVLEGRVAVAVRNDGRSYPLTPGQGIDVPNAGAAVGPRQWPQPRVDDTLARCSID